MTYPLVGTCASVKSSPHEKEEGSTGNTGISEILLLGTAEMWQEMKVSPCNFGPIKVSFFFFLGDISITALVAHFQHTKRPTEKNHTSINVSSFTYKFSAWYFFCLVFIAAVAKACGVSGMQTDTFIQIILVNL